MKAQTLLLDSLNTRWGKYKTELKACQREFSEEAVHDFRVAIRRLLAFLDLLCRVIKDPRIQKVRRTLKDQLDQLDNLRDIQVLLVDVSEKVEEAPVLKLYQEYLQHKEKKLLSKARKKIKSLKTANLSMRIRKLTKTIEDLEQPDLELSFFSAVDEAYAIVIQRYTLVDPIQPATIHHLRIAFKRFRYMIEVIFPVLQDFPADYLKKLHDYQGSMGDIQDAEVALQELKIFDELAPAFYDPTPARSYYNERHAAALLHYIKDKNEVITYWRSAPDQSFLQEK